jgi:hypothetical protein
MEVKRDAMVKLVRKLGRRKKKGKKERVKLLGYPFDCEL